MGLLSLYQGRIETGLPGRGHRASGPKGRYSPSPVGKNPVPLGGGRGEIRQRSAEIPPRDREGHIHIHIYLARTSDNQDIACAALITVPSTVPFTLRHLIIATRNVAQKWIQGSQD